MGHTFTSLTHCTLALSNVTECLKKRTTTCIAANSV